MIDLKDLRANPDKYRLGAKNKAMPADIDGLLAVDAAVRGAQTQLQELTAEKNRLSKDIGPPMGLLKKADGAQKAELEAKLAALKARPLEIASQEPELEESIRQLEAGRLALWLKIPQPADAQALFGPLPVGSDAEGNQEIRRVGTPAFDPGKSFAQNKGFTPKTHLELIENLGLADFQRGVKMAGSRSYVLTGLGQRLHNAVLQFAFNRMCDRHGFQAMSVPVLVREELMTGTGFFPAGREQAYCIEESKREDGGRDLFLTGTGEVGLMGFHQDEILEEETLPRRYTTVSTCFRREAGAAGRDTAGLYRIHQFDKVEQIVICRADEMESRDWHQKMLGFVEELLAALELPYRLLQCCTGDLGVKNADMVDVECWMPGRGDLGKDGRPQGAWGETHSASRLYDFQTRRLNLRYRAKLENGKTEVRFCHSLNNTVLASPRILIPLLEIHQNADGSVTVPPALRPYLGGLEVIGRKS